MVKKQRFAALILAVALFAAVLAPQAFAAYETGKYRITPDNGVNLRAGAGTKYDKVGALACGTEVQVTEISGNWGKTTAGGTTGWFLLDNAKFISGNSSSEESEKPPALTEGSYLVTTALNLREGPAASEKKLASIPEGAVIMLSEVSGSWGKTTYDGKTGWVNTAYLKAYEETSVLTSDVYAIGYSTALKKEADASSDTLVTLPLNTELTVTEIKGGWGKTTYKSYTGWFNLANAGAKLKDSSLLTGDQRKDMIAIARNELGKTNGSKYTFGRGNVAWCAYFVSWVARQAGVSTSIIKTAGYARAYSHGVTYYPRDKYLPSPGDLAYFDWPEYSGDMNHVGIVEEVKEDGTIVTIEGNASGTVARRTYSKASTASYRAYTSISYFGVPDYATKAKAVKTCKVSADDKGTVKVSWSATDASYYDAYVIPAKGSGIGDSVQRGRTTAGSITFSDLPEGSYKCVVYARPGSTAASAASEAASFTIKKGAEPASEEPASEEPATETPPAEEPSSEAPAEEEKTYELTVKNGKGGGSYKEGEKVTVTADEPAKGKVFSAWKSSGKGSFADAKASKTVFTMPAENVTVTAVYEDAPEEAPAESGGAVYKAATVLNLREKATVSSTLLLKIPEGTKLTVVDYSGKWGKTTYNGKTGWINLDFADLVSDDSSQDPLPSGGTVYKAATQLNLREKATVSSALLLRIPEGTKLAIGERSGKWGKTTYKGKTGWVNLDFAEKVSSSETPAEESSQPVTPPADETVVEAATTLNLREKPTASSTLLLKIPEGTKVTVGERSGKWAKTTYSGKTGWVNLDFTRKPTESGEGQAPAEDPAQTEKTVVEAATTLNLREKPTASSTLLLKIPEGTKVTVGDRSGKWAKTTYNGKTGWVNLDFTRKPTESGEGQAPAEDPAQTEKTVVEAATTLNLREKPTADSTLLLKIPEGTKVTVGERSGKWAKTTYNGKTGWVNLDFTRKPTESGEEQAPAEESGRVKEETYKAETTLNLREKPTADSTLLLKIPEGTKITVGERSGKWAKTTYNGKTGWVNLDFAKKVSGSGDSSGVSGTSYVTTADLSLRADKSTSSKRLLIIPDGTKVTITEVSGKWGKTTYNGKTGWVYMDYVKKK